MTYSYLEWKCEGMKMNEEERSKFTLDLSRPVDS